MLAFFFSPSGRFRPSPMVACTTVCPCHCIVVVVLFGHAPWNISGEPKSGIHNSVCWPRGTTAVTAVDNVLR